jgi:hypothetical protein
MRITTLAVVSLFALIAPTKAADAGSKHLSLGEIAILPSGATNMTPALRSALVAEMGDLDLRGSHKDAILSVSLVKLDSERERGVASTTCVISATLRSRDGGVLFAVLEGRARAQGSSDHLSENAVRGAVHGALSRIPDALK